MSVTLKIYLMGLVALVPSQDGANLTILMQQTPEVHGEHGQDSHVPLVVWDDSVNVKTYIGGKVEPLDDGKKIRERLDPFYLALSDDPKGLILEGESIGIEGTQQGRMRGLQSRSWILSFLGAVPENQAELTRTIWMPKMSRLSRRAGPVKQELLKAPSPQQLAGFFQLNDVEFNLSSFSLASFKGDITSFAFPKDVAKIRPWHRRQAMTDIALLEMKIDKPSVVIDIVPLKGGDSGRRRIELTPKSGKVVELLLGNLSPLNLDPCNLSNESDHFPIYYSLLRYGDNVEPRIPVAGKRKRPENALEKHAIPQVIYSVSGDCLYGAEIEAQCKAAGSSGEEPPFGGLCRPICGIPLLSAPRQ